jgi:hypothetical protein
VKLYRPVGLRELELIAESGWRAYPPRLFWQPIFYPVLTLEYALIIVNRWNQFESDAGHCGFVTAFDIDDRFALKYPVQQLGGGSIFRELWVPSEELDEWNRHIQGLIAVDEKVYGPSFRGEIDRITGLPKSVSM